MNTASSGLEANDIITRSADEQLIFRVKGSEAMVFRDKQTNTSSSGAEGQRPRLTLRDQKTLFRVKGPEAKVNIARSADKHIFLRVKGSEPRDQGLYCYISRRTQPFQGQRVRGPG
jgi:hypothetical protein